MFFLNKWRHLLLGAEVEVLSDHHTLQWKPFLTLSEDGDCNQGKEFVAELHQELAR
jgi:hypothetical protein